MKITAAFKWFILGSKPLPPEYPRWPNRGETEVWMRGKIAHFRAHYPDQAHYLFDLSCADYLPNTVHGAGNFGPAELSIYRRLKAENPDLVEQARQSTRHRFSRSLICDPEDWPADGMLP